MNIRLAENDDLEAIKRFNERIRAGGREEQITLRISLPGEARYKSVGTPVCRRLMIAEDGEEVRAAMLLYYHNIFVNGEKRDFCFADMPISEGIVNRKYSFAIVQLITTAIKNAPFMISTGAGPLDKESFRFLAKLGWRHAEAPFFFYPVNTSNVMRGLRYLKKRPNLYYGAMAAAYSGLGAGLNGALKLRRRISDARLKYEKKVIDAFDEWANHIFEDSLPEYGAVVRSDAVALNIAYSPESSSITRLKVRQKGSRQDIGWIIVAVKQMHDNPYFGDLKVGTLVDGLGRLADASRLIAAGISHLIEIGVDIIVANFSHAGWVEACRFCGMFEGPANYYFFVSPQASPLLLESCSSQEIHIVRGHSNGMSGLI